MFDVTFEILGERFKQIREYLQLSQKELAEKLSIKQSAVSALENGVGGKINNLVNLLSFYSKYVYIDSLFQKEFYIYGKNEDNSPIKTTMNTVTAELLIQSHEKYIGKLNELNEKLKNDIEKVVDHLKD